MRKLLVVAVSIAGLLAIAIAARDPLSFAYLRHRVRPPVAFAASVSPAPPDYANPEHWAALPDRADAADGAPVGADPDAQATARADVFFVHPTTYYRRGSWNQPLDDEGTNRFTDRVVIRGAASVFNACCRIYAPRYRQATLYALPLFDESGDGGRALDLAYRDVEAAFEHFLAHENDGRPFFVAAHSEGSLHARWLLERRIAGSAAAERLIAAYLIGYGVGRRDLAEHVPEFPICDSPTAQHCLVSWNAVAPGAALLEDTADHVCVNPLTWREDGALAPPEANAGAVFFDAAEAAPIDLSAFETRLLSLLARTGEETDGAAAEARAPRVEVGAADAQCVDGRLVVREIRSDVFRPSPLWGDNYHGYDYSLFWMNLRENAAQRLAASE